MATNNITAVVRRGSQLRYDLFTELVASSCRIVRNIRPVGLLVKFVASPLFMFYGKIQ